MDQYCGEEESGRGVSKPQQDHLPFAKWYVGRASVDSISRLLLRSKPRVAESILQGGRWLEAQESIPGGALEEVAQMMLKQSSDGAAETGPHHANTEQDAPWPRFRLRSWLHLAGIEKIGPWTGRSTAFEALGGLIT